jgi:hypothetical protein
MDSSMDTYPDREVSPTSAHHPDDERSSEDDSDSGIRASTKNRLGASGTHHERDYEAPPVDDMALDQPTTRSNTQRFGSEPLSPPSLHSQRAELGNNADSDIDVPFLNRADLYNGNLSSMERFVHINFYDGK